MSMGSTFEHSVTSAFFFSAGLQLLGRRSLTYNKTNDRIFRENFGVRSSVLAQCWKRISSFLYEKYGSGSRPQHLLWACHFLKTYGTESTLASQVGADEKTFRKWIWILVYALADLAPEVIVWNNRKEDDDGEDCLVSIDCTDLVIQSPSYSSGKIWYSFKHNGPGIRYEIALSLKHGHIVWVEGPYPCGQWPDIKIFRHCLRNFLDPSERVEADDGYMGDQPKYCKTPGGFSSRTENIDEERRRIRARHETVNLRLKHFGILNKTYRHNLKDHAFVFGAVAVLVQLSLENGDPLFEL